MYSLYLPPLPKLFPDPPPFHTHPILCPHFYFLFFTSSAICASIYSWSVVFSSSVVDLLGSTCLNEGAPPLTVTVSCQQLLDYGGTSYYPSILMSGFSSGLRWYRSYTRCCKCSKFKCATVPLCSEDSVSL